MDDSGHLGLGTLFKCPHALFIGHKARHVHKKVQKKNWSEWLDFIKRLNYYGTLDVRRMPIDSRQGIVRSAIQNRGRSA